MRRRHNPSQYCKCGCAKIWHYPTIFHMMFNHPSKCDLCVCNQFIAEGPDNGE